MRVIKVLVITAFFSACSDKQNVTEQDPQQLRSEVPPVEVQTVPVREVPFEYLIHAAGKIQSLNDIEIQSQTTGVVERVWLPNGAQVTKGETILTLTHAQQALARDKARLQLQEREIAYQDALLGYTKTDSLRMKQAKENIRISSGLAAAEIAFKEAQLEWEQTIIKAPISGTISNLEVHTGSLLTPNQTVCRVHTAKELLITTELLEADALLLKPGMVADVRLLGEASNLTAKVYQLNPRVDEKTNLVKVQLKITGAARLLPGMTTQITLKVPHEKAMVVPREAVVIRSGRQVVFTAQEGLAKWNYVTVGRENGKNVEIIEGLTEGQQAIVTNNLQLAHDAMVKYE